MRYNLCYFTFVIFTVLSILPLHTLAAWTIDNPPRRPDDVEVRKTCFEWIVYHGFTIGHDIQNQARALYRASHLDGEAFSFAVGYAYVLSGFNVLPLTMSPVEFCRSRGIRNTKVFYMALKDENRTCIDWLHLYGYEIDNNNINWQKARRRDFSRDNHISHWVAAYGQVLCRLDVNDAISPAAFCSELGIHPNRLLSFKTRNGTRLTCSGWIKFHDFTDNGARNVVIAQRIYNLRHIYLGQIHYWAKYYAAAVLAVRPPGIIMTPLEYCRNVPVYDDQRFLFFPF